MCKTLNVQSFECGCYLCDSTRRGKTNAEIPNHENCEALAKNLDEKLLSGCTSFKQ